MKNIEEIQEELKNKYWKPEWDSMPEEERFKDLQYTTYLHEILVTGLAYAKEKRKECTESLQIELMDVMIEGYEKMLENFSQP